MPARTTLTTVEEIKSRLSIPSGDTSRDAQLDAYREAVEEDILALTGYTFVAGPRTETFGDWQRGTTRLMGLRPVLSLTSVTGRVLGSTGQINTLDADIKDAQKGRVMVIGFQDGFHDPRYGESGASAPWFKWREYTWPQVTVTYVPDPLGSETNPVPRALIAAATEWVASIMMKPAGTGPLQSVSIESVSESYGQGAKGSMPQIVQTLLARHIRDTVAMRVP